MNYSYALRWAAELTDEYAVILDQGKCVKCKPEAPSHTRVIGDAIILPGTKGSFSYHLQGAESFIPFFHVGIALLEATPPYVHDSRTWTYECCKGHPGDVITCTVDLTFPEGHGTVRFARNGRDMGIMSSTVKGPVRPYARCPRGGTIAFWDGDASQLVDREDTFETQKKVIEMETEGVIEKLEKLTLRDPTATPAITSITEVKAEGGGRGREKDVERAAKHNRNKKGRPRYPRRPKKDTKEANVVAVQEEQKKKKKKKKLSFSYVRKTLDDDDVKGYKAAALLPLFFNKDTKQQQVLMVYEHVRKTGLDRLGFLGGKREPCDVTPFATAQREFLEETGWETFPATSALRDPSNARVLFAPNSKMALFAIQLQDCSDIDSLLGGYHASVEQKDGSTLSVEWVAVTDLINAFKKLRQFKKGEEPAEVLVNNKLLRKFIVFTASVKHYTDLLNPKK